MFAADGSRLGFVQSDVLRRVVPFSGHAAGDAPGDGRDRGRALLQARGRRLQRDHPRRHQEPRVGQDRAGRLDDHPAARARALHPRSQARLRAQDPRGQAGLRARGEALEALDPPRVPELGALRHRRRAHGDRRAGRGRDLLRQGRRRPQPRRVGAARGPAAGALASTTRSATRRPLSAAATRCCGRCSTTTTSSQAELLEADGRAAQAEARHALHRSAASPTSSTTCRRS